VKGCGDQSLNPSSGPNDSTAWTRIAEAVIGVIDDAPADMAEHYDRYLYGQPKV
jgi:hypothetical protein